MEPFNVGSSPCVISSVAIPKYPHLENGEKKPSERVITKMNLLMYIKHTLGTEEGPTVLLPLA